MLMDSIRLNYDIMGTLRQKLKIVICVTLGLLFFLSCSNDHYGMFLPALVTTAIGTGISMGIFLGMFRRVFYQSMFEEEAYTYMLFPLSSRSVVYGKLIAVLYTLIWSGIVYLSMWVYLYAWWRDLSYGEVYWDVVIPQSLTEDLLVVGHQLFQRNFAASTVAFLIGTAIFQFLISAGLFCSGVQICNILDHLHNPNGKKNYVGVLLGLALVGVIAACLVLPTKIFCLISDGIITVLPLVITMGLEILLIVLCMKLSVWLLQTKYALN